MRLIDADEVVETLFSTEDLDDVFSDLAQKRGLDYLHDVEELEVLDFARDVVRAVVGVINTSPTVDAVEVVHGHWIYDHWCEFKCSNCGEWSNSKPYRGREKYCPNCGAKMDEVSED